MQFIHLGYISCHRTTNMIWINNRLRHWAGPRKILEEIIFAEKTKTGVFCFYKLYEIKCRSLWEAFWKKLSPMSLTFVTGRSFSWVKLEILSFIIPALWADKVTLEPKHNVLFDLFFDQIALCWGHFSQWNFNNH